ncbi:MAG: single-stranded-DNA-specific exonuclease RecJ [Clostridia bacterium]|nr:single-stranded-DNA-specific exonuclease RecJ [Clostridia bacterium]
MKLVYGKTLNADETLTVQNIAKSCDVLFDTARLLFYRNVDTVDKAKRFLSAGKHGFYSPFLFSGMKDAVERISLAKERDENILVFGDYDADGVCATTVLYYCLTEFGIKNLRIYVPEREEGYGLNVDMVTRFNEEKPVDLLITVDCGISDFDKIERLNSLGIDVIVTDHHEPPEILPDCIKVNPKLVGQEYPESVLCGAGVAYKLGYALIGKAADKYLDFVALATVADSMDLIGENRDIVVEGLKLFNDKKTLKLPFKNLLGENNKIVSAQTLAYVIAPRINAGGRMGDANAALELFTAKEPEHIYDLSVKLNGYNIERQTECDNIYHEAKIKIKKYSLETRDVILVKDEKWSAGFIGIVAAKLVEDYGRPVIVFAGHDDYLKGSARSVEPINIHDAITAVKDLLIGFGGHSQAAGVSVSKENFSAFDLALNTFVKNNYGKTDFEQKIYADWDVSDEISERFAREIDMLEPFGVGNRRPIFTTEVGAITSLPLKAGSLHYFFKCKPLEILDFNGQKHVQTLSLPIKKKVLFEINVSTFKSKLSVKGYARAVLPEYGDFNGLDEYILENELSKIDGERTFKWISRAEFFNGNGTGTLYAISDPKNLSLYPELSTLPRSLFVPEGKNFSDCIVVSLKEVPDGFSRVIYLDTPVSIVNSDVPCAVVKDVCGYKFIKRLSTDRVDFARIFNQLRLLSGKIYKGSADFAFKYANPVDRQQFVFVTEVFLQLNIFSVKNGIFTYNEKVKNALTNSKLYSKIVLLKESYV